jgi:hypothetical protein
MTKAERDVIIANLGLLVTELYGPRCPDKEAGCVCCTAWAIFDVMNNLTDGSLLLDE